MKRMLCVLLVCLLLCGCGAQEPTVPETEMENAPAAVQTEAPAPTEPAPQYLQLQPLPNYQVDAEVHSYGAEYAVSAQMVPLNQTAEELLTMVFPDDTSQQSVETVEFRRIVTTQQGSSLTRTSSYFTAFRGGYTHEDLWEMEILLTGWAEEHPEEAVHPLDFMTPEQAMEQALELFRQMNVGYEPVVDTFAALTGPEINAYQQVCLDDPMYTEFGKFHMLPELGADHDAYYLSFSFAFHGIPLGDPSVVSDTYGVTFAPQASMLITRQGIAYISCMSLCSLESVMESRLLISPEEAVQRMQTVVQGLYAEESYLTTLIELRYLPLPIDGKITLVPYWGMELVSPEMMEFVALGTHPYQICYWFNAFTGTHYLDE